YYKRLYDIERCEWCGNEVFQPGRSAPPLAVSLPSEELLLGKNDKLIPEGRICWTESPAVVVIHKPYAISLLPKHIELS
ncbi:Vam6/Vps39-like protein, partial [Tanacetum coccineum]